MVGSVNETVVEAVEPMNEDTTPKRSFPRKPTITLGQGKVGQWRCGATIPVEGETWIEISEYRKDSGWMHAGWARQALDGVRIVSAMNTEPRLLEGCEAAREIIQKAGLEVPEKLKTALSLADVAARIRDGAEIAQAKSERARKSAFRQWERQAKLGNDPEPA